MANIIPGYQPASARLETFKRKRIDIDDNNIPDLSYRKIVEKHPSPLKPLAVDTVSFRGKVQTSKLDIGQIVADVERRIKNNPVETAVIIDSKTGKILDESKGSKDEIYVNEKLVKGNILTHNHPEKRVPITFSESDILSALENRAKEIRAVTPSGIYYSFKFPEKLSSQDFNNLTDIFLTTAFDCEEYKVVRSLIKINDKGEYLNSKKELQFISGFTNDLWSHIADVMKDSGYDVEYKTGKIS